MRVHYVRNLVLGYTHTAACGRDVTQGWNKTDNPNAATCLQCIASAKAMGES